jgi:glycosyltransferase involved in cell wall biosynthesis
MARPRILLLSQAGLDLSDKRLLDVLQRRLSSEFEVSAETIAGEASVVRMPRLVSGLRRRIGSGISLVHAFGSQAMAIAAMAFASPVLYTPSDPSRGTAKWVRAASGYRNVHVVCASAAEERIFVEAGVPAKRCQVIRPGVDFGRVKKQRDVALRTELGFAETDRVMLLVGESGTFAGHAQALWAAAILHVLDPKFKVLVCGPGNQLRRLKHFAESQKHVGFLTVARERLAREIAFEELLPASDVLLVTPTGPMPALPICIAMASGLPIVGTAGSLVGEFLEDRHTALLTKAGSPKSLAQRVLDLETDPGLAWKLGEQARGEAYEFFSMSGQAEKFAELYRRLVQVEAAAGAAT